MSRVLQDEYIFMHTSWGKLLQPLNSMASLSMINHEQDFILKKKNLLLLKWTYWTYLKYMRLFLHLILLAVSRSHTVQMVYADETKINT